MYLIDAEQMLLRVEITVNNTLLVVLIKILLILPSLSTLSRSLFRSYLLHGLDSYQFYTNFYALNCSCLNI